MPVTLRSGFGFSSNPRTWPTGTAEARATLRAALDQAERCGARGAPAGEQGSVIGATHLVAWSVALQCPSEFLLYLASPLDGAHVTLRLPRSMIMRLDDLGSEACTERELAVDNAWDAVVVDLPASTEGVLLHLR